MSLDLGQIEAFSAVVREGSLGRGAAALNVTQPAVTRLIQRLERRLGAPLFERRTTGVILTEVGRAFQPHAELLRLESDRALEDIRAVLGLSRGTARIGAIASVAYSILPEAIRRTLTRSPDLRFEILEGVNDVLATALTRREIDLAFIAEAPDTDDIVAIRRFRWSDTTVIVTAGDHPLQREYGVTLDRLVSELWALPPRGTSPYLALEGVFSAKGLGLPRIAVETRSISTLKNLVMTAGFLSFMAEPMFEPERKANLIQALPLPDARLHRGLLPFQRRRGLLPRPAAALLGELSQLIKAGH